MGQEFQTAGGRVDHALKIQLQIAKGPIQSGRNENDVAGAIFDCARQRPYRRARIRIHPNVRNANAHRVIGIEDLGFESVAQRDIPEVDISVQSGHESSTDGQRPAGAEIALIKDKIGRNGQAWQIRRQIG